LRILFDKNVPYQLRLHLVGHEVRTAAEEGWDRLVNGDLLKAAEEEGFEVMVTADPSAPRRSVATSLLGMNCRRNQR